MIVDNEENFQPSTTQRNKLGTERLPTTHLRHSHTNITLIDGERKRKKRNDHLPPYPTENDPGHPSMVAKQRCDCGLGVA